MDEHFKQFQKKHRFRVTDKEPTCYSCKGFDSIDGHEFICLASEKDLNYMKVSITTVCSNFSPARLKGRDKLADNSSMTKYCVKKKHKRKAERHVYEFQKTEEGIRLSRNGILDGIMKEQYFNENFVEVKK